MFITVKRVIPLAMAMLCLVITQLPADSRTKVPQEDIAWCDIWIPHSASEAHKRVLMIGDSISRQYYSEVEAALEGKAYCARLATSRGATDPILWDEVKMVLKQYIFDIVHVNNGLHEGDMPTEEYIKGVDVLIRTIQKAAPHARLIWAMTTPTRVSGQLDRFAESNTRMRERNAAVLKLISGKPIAIDDLYAVGESQIDYYSPDGTHFSASGVTALAAKVTKSISDALGDTVKSAGSK